MLARLNLVLSSPPKPEVVAVNEFERDQVWLSTRGQDSFSRNSRPGGKPKHGRPNSFGSAGKSGSGIYWDEPELPTIEEEQARKEQQERARRNEEERRARKLARKEARLVAKTANEEQREQQRKQQEAAARLLQEQKERERQEQAWMLCAKFPLDDAKDWLDKVLREGKSQRMQIVEPDGTSEDRQGVFTYIKADGDADNDSGSDKFHVEEPPFKGWYPLIVQRLRGMIFYRYFHSLSVVSCGSEIVYAPWLNPHLPEHYHAECRKRFPDKPMAFETADAVLQVA